MRRALLPFGTIGMIFVFLAPLGCKDDVPISASPASSALKEVPMPSAPPPSIAREALAAASATALPSSTKPAPSGSTAPRAKGADASAQPLDSGAPEGCGTKPQPDCPLQGWMKANSQVPLAAGDLAALGNSFDAIVKFAPQGYTNWVSISKDGAQAARAGNLDAAKAACRACHEQYKSKYKTEMRDRKL